MRLLVSEEAAFLSKTEENGLKVLKDFQKESLVVKNGHFLCKMTLKSEIGIPKSCLCEPVGVMV